MVPESIVYTPVRALIRVDFPAPFSPIRAWTSPWKSRKPTPSSAFTPGKPMEISVISTTGTISFILLSFLCWVCLGGGNPCGGRMCRRTGRAGTG